ncbi:site-2 protease family protein [Hyphomicrobium sp.]|uniref:site-2 protease family protein n=1 Tax=Hyphomicrobium sp. TaxID=82 RepID=UPI000FBE050C|nr:site-2 protease family protein [Hyphomicrobium sp.]RUP11006.1 MAG: site-2 protease family protein [Hyphomicrobium sp.]
MMIDTISDVAFFVVAFAASFIVFRIFAQVVAILRVPYWSVKTTRVAQPPALDVDQQQAVNELRSLGFEPVFTDRLEAGPISYDEILFQHSDGYAYAYLAFFVSPTTGFTTRFISFRSDGKILLTANYAPMYLLAVSPEIESVDALAPSLAEHWNAHNARLTGVPVVRIDATEADRRIKARSADDLLLLIKSGALVKGRDGAFHPTLRSAIRIVWRQWATRTKHRGPYRSVLLEEPSQSILFARAYEEFAVENERRPPRPNVTAAVLIITLAMSVALWGSALSWNYAVLLALVLFVHEAGHAIAMKAFGYRDISMFFIPLFGAVVTGTAKEMPAWKQAVVILAGPLPGLLAGMGFLIYRGFHSFDTETFDMSRIAFVAVLINLANLLPLTPLDGGRLLEISVFNRWPRARLVFSVLSVAAFSGLAMYLRDPLVVSAAAFFAYTLRSQWHLTELQRAWKEGLSTREQLIRLSEIARNKFGVRSFARKYGLIKGVFDRRKMLPTRMWESVVVLSLMVLIWAPVAAVAIALLPQKQRAVPAPVDSRSPSQKAFDEAVDAYFDEDPQRTTVATIESLGAPLDAQDKRRNDIIVLKAVELPHPQRSSKLASLLEERRDGIWYPLRTLGGEFLRATLDENADKSIDVRIVSLKDGIDRVMRFFPDDLRVTADYWITLAELYDKAGKPEQAWSTLEGLKTNLRMTKAPPFLFANAVRAEADFQIAHGEPAKAAALLESAMSDELKDRPNMLLLDDAWARVFAGDLNEGGRIMRLAAYSPPRELTFLQKALGRSSKGYLLRPFDLAYVMIKEGHVSEAAALVKKETPRACREKPWHSPTAWNEARNRAVDEAFNAICAAPK